jgi:hypothetical protein
MSESKINEQILLSLKKNCKNDDILEKFLKDLIYEEIHRGGQWKWKEIYRDKVKKYSTDWRVKDEN